MQWQQKQVEKYCRKYGLVGEQYQLPNATETVVRKNLFRHLLFDDSRKLIFCFIPKVQSTHNYDIHIVIINFVKWKGCEQKGGVPEIQSNLTANRACRDLFYSMSSQ